MLEMHQPVVNDFGGAPFAEHDYACPICWERPAHLALNTGVFNPCDPCREAGWELRKRKYRPGRFTWAKRR